MKVTQENISSLEKFLLESNAREDMKFERVNRINLFFNDNLIDEITSGSYDEKMTMQIAELASTARKWIYVKSIWLYISEKYPKCENLANFHIGIAERMCGNLNESLRYLSLVTGKLRTRTKYKREFERLHKAIGFSTIKNLQDLSQISCDNLQYEKARSYFYSSLYLQNLPEYQVRRMGALYKEIAADNKNTRTKILRDFPKIFLNKLCARKLLNKKTLNVFICGFGWSGSGAVYDYLKQSSSIFDPFEGVEISCFDGLPNSGLGVSELSRLRNEPDEYLYPRFVEMFLTVILGQMFKGLNPSGHTKMLKKSLFYQFSKDPDYFNKFMGSTELFFNVIKNESFRSKEKCFNYFNDYFSSVLSIKSDRKKSVNIFNNCIHAPNVNAIEFVNKSLACVVTRDPRDQYVARYHESSRGKISPNTFVSNWKNNWYMYQKSISDSKFKSRIHTIAFEEFVINNNARLRVLEFLGLSACSIGDSKIFSPDNSFKNISIFKEFENQESIRFIERELGSIEGVPFFESLV